MAQALAALRVRNYRLFFAGQVLSQTGNFMQILAQAWLVLQLHGTAVDLGLVTAIQFVPLLVLSPFAGALVEGVDKRRLLLVTQTLGLLDALVLGLLVTTGVVTVWSVFVLAGFLGLVGAVESPARHVFVFDMVGRELIGNAVSLNEVAINASRILGPAVAGVIISQWGPGTCFLVNTVSYLPAIGALLAMRQVTAALPAVRVAGGQPFREGLRYVASAPALRSLLILVAASAMIFNFGVAVPVLADSSLHVGARGYGMIVAAFGIGALIGAFVAASDPAPTAVRARWLALATGLLLVGCAVMPNLYLELLLQAVTGCVAIWFVAVANGALQLLTSPLMRSRVMGLWAMCLPGSTPLTGVLIGWITGALGGRAGLAGVGLVLLVCVGATWAAVSGQRVTRGSRAARA